MKIVPDNAQHIGVRKEQQDAFGFSDLGQDTLTRRIGALSVVADGMGGMEQGQEMSRLACRTMIEAYAQKSAEEPIPRALSHALQTANSSVLQRARQLGVLGETGTTLSAAVIHGDGLYWTSVGDSRIYLYRDGMLTQLTVDHGYARHLERKVAAGEISAQRAAEHPERHAITSFLGLDTLEEIDRTVKPFPLRPGDRVLLCTDGLHGSLSDEEIGEILRTHTSGAAQALVDAALAKQRRNQDNVTATLFDYLPNGSPEGRVGGLRALPITTVFAPRRSVRTPRVLVVALLLVVLSGAGIVLWGWRSFQNCRATPERTRGECLLALLPGQQDAAAQPAPAPGADGEAPVTELPADSAPQAPAEGGTETPEQQPGSGMPGENPDPQPNPGAQPVAPAEAAPQAPPQPPRPHPTPAAPSPNPDAGGDPTPGSEIPPTPEPAPQQPSGSVLGRLWDWLRRSDKSGRPAEPREIRHSAHPELVVEADSDAALSALLP